MNRRGPSWRIRIALAIGGLVFALLAAEVLYRIQLRASLAGSLGQSFTVASRPIYAEDLELGYRYIPESQALRVTLHEGTPVDVGPLLVNAEGDIGPVDPGWDEADLRILIVGDSFTANPYHGITWTESFAAELESRVGVDVAIRNLGRDGFGVLQMMHLAALAVPQLRPDLLVIAIIPDDLVRTRFRRFVVTDEGTTRLMTTYRPTQPPRMSESVDVELVDSRVSGRWAESARLLPDDRVLQDLLGRYRTLALRREGPDFLRLTGSFLADRILHGDPLRSVTRISRERRWAQRDFRVDPTFRRDVETLLAADVPISLVLLPTREDLTNREHRVNDQSRDLLLSLEESLGRETTYLLPYLRIAPEQTDRLFLLPYDQHPNWDGARVYGSAVAQALAEQTPWARDDSTSAPSGNR